MPTCKKCAGKFPTKAIVDGKLRYLNKRSYCLTCSPFGTHNTRKIETGDAVTATPRLCPKCQKPYNKGSICASCRVTQTRRATKLRAVAYLGGKCCKCNYSKSIAALQFHHKIKGEKAYTISNYSISWDKVKAELDKCELLCANCHAETHEAT